MTKRVAVTGGSGFIGAYLVRHLVESGWKVCVLDNLMRGDDSRLASVIDDVQLHQVDVRDEQAVTRAIKGHDVVMHLAAINGTENFYKHPELVLDVGIRGALAVVNACRSAGVPDLVLASSAEVYQTPARIPTPEDIELMLPDSLNPRYSYGGSKIISELIAFNYAREHFRKVQVFRPHNVYGPDMGTKHVIPQFIIRAAGLQQQGLTGGPFPIQGSGKQTRGFCYVDDAVRGILRMYEYGQNREIYHIGNDDEVSMAQVVDQIGHTMGLSLEVEPSAPAEGGTPRRCPDITKMRMLGYEPVVELAAGIEQTVKWYQENLHRLSQQGLL